MSLYRRVLAEKFETLPRAIKEAHAFQGQQYLSGEADVCCNETMIGTLLLRLLGLPRSGKGQTASIQFEEDGQGERWHRRFGRDNFSSRVKLHETKPGPIVETMGGVSAVIGLQVLPEGLRWDIESLSLLGLPLPRCIAPVTQATEREVDGLYRFDVSITLPLLGPLITYRGWLQPDSARPPPQIL